MTLNEIKPGKSVVIKKMMATGAMKKKLMDMGLTKHTELFVKKVAPLGDPIELTVRGYELSIRKADAATIEVE
ncbi:FeoA family protein [[Eubacterium] hominis]|uniref:FeoA family protein n=1 Tax=[Eubacterium] hominis TaxID=2764325 RepID=UPI003A4E38F2